MSGTNFEVDLFKLMNNSVFDKTLENIRNRVDIRLISSDKVAQKLAAKSTFDRCMIFDDNLITVHMKKTKLYFSNPVYLGMSILGLSKSVVYDFHYNHIKTKYGNNAKFLILSLMKLGPKILTKISTPTLRNGLTLVTNRLIILLELKHYLMVKCLECLRMKLVESRLFNLLVWERKFTLTNILDGSEDKKCKGWQRMLQKDSMINSMTIEMLVWQEVTTSKNECHTKSLSWDLYRRS